MKTYELTILFRPDLGEKELDKATKNWTEHLEKAGGKIVKKVDAAKKSLAYEIKKFHEAYYLYLETTLPAQNIVDLEKKLLVDEAVIRHLLIKKD